MESATHPFFNRKIADPITRQPRIPSPTTCFFMKKQPFFNLAIRLGIFGLFAFLLFPFALISQSEEPSDAEMMAKIDSLDKSFKWQTGKIELKSGLASINVPAGFRFLNIEQSRFVLEQLWGNPADESTLGMLFPLEIGPLDSNSFAFNLSFDEIGYVKDDDADKIDYADLLKTMQKESGEANPEREKAGFATINIIGWANPPFYDKNRKVLHWAKEIQFGDATENTLNYDVRVLGRKGVLSMNAVGGMSALPLVKQNIDGLVAGVEFGEGQKYFDFDPKLDEVAAYTIGGLVAGKVLAKAGIFVLLAKFAKPLMVLGAGAFYGLRKFFGRRRKEDEETDLVSNEKATEPDPSNLDEKKDGTI